MQPIDVIGIGAATVDLLSRVDHFPAGREVQRAVELEVQGGGPVATAVLTVARLGGRAAMIDILGDDWRGDLIRREFQANGVLTDFLQLRKGCLSSTSCILVSQANGDRAIVYAPGSTPELALGPRQRQAIRAARILHLSGRHGPACLEGIEIAHRAGVRVSLDGGADRYTPEMKSLVPQTDICITAGDFARKCTGEADLEKAAAALSESGPELVVVTDGPRGSWVRERTGRAFHQSAFLFPSVVDTTGCGDSFHGAFLFGLVRGWELERTAALASAVAGMNTQQLGGRKGLPSLAQAEAFLRARQA